MRSPIRLVYALASVTLAACSSRDVAGGDGVGGTLIISSAEDADALLPPLVANSVGKQAVDALFLPFAQMGDDMSTLGDKGFTPRLAQRWEWAPDSLSITFFIDPRARWHDDQPVRASDVRYTLAVFRDPVIASFGESNLDLIDSVSVRDSLAFTVWYKHRSPEQFFDFVYNVIPIPAHVYGAIPSDSLRASAAARAPVGSGKFRFVRWVTGSMIEVIADTANFLSRPKLDRVIWSNSPNPTTATTKVLAGEADFIEFLRGDAVKQAAENPGVREVERQALDYGNLVFNFRDPKDTTRPHPLLSNRALRRAIVMAVDRAAIEKNVFDTLGVVMTGPFLHSQPIKPTTPLPFDSAAASRALDSLGWRDSNGDGIRDRNGKRLELTFAAPMSSTARVRASVLMQEQLRKVGIKANLEHLEMNTFQHMAPAGKFDAVFAGWTGDPSIFALRQFWLRGGTGGANWGHYYNPSFEILFDSARAAQNPRAGAELLARAGQLLVDDAPGIWLYEARGMTAIHRRVRPAPMRADAWWANLDAWSIDPAQRIDRDRIGLRARTAK